MKTILINALEVAVLYHEVPDRVSREKLINLTTKLFNQSTGRNLRTLTHAEYVEDPIICETDLEAYQVEQQLPPREQCLVYLRPELEVLFVKVENGFDLWRVNNHRVNLF